MEPKTDILDTVSSHQERYSEMERLNKECLADKISQLNCDDFAITEMVNTANYIHDNLSTMTEEELRRYYVKIMNVSKIKNELLMSNRLRGFSHNDFAQCKQHLLFLRVS